MGIAAGTLESLAMIRQPDPSFWRGKRVFLTGHTGFKGGWLALWLTQLGAQVHGYALAPTSTPDLFTVLKLDQQIAHSEIGDIRDEPALTQAMQRCQPEVVFHMAAQPLVRHSYQAPVETYSTNVMGTVHILQAIRTCPSVKGTVVVTSDKCYENREWPWGYRENEAMGGFDPYSSSKGCAELVVAAYRQSFFSGGPTGGHPVAIATARAGNVIGGGDWADDRLVPDAIRAFAAGKTLNIRNPGAIRPWQHVLEPLTGYLLLAQMLHQHGSTFADGWNFGPEEKDTRTVGEVADQLSLAWGTGAKWQGEQTEQPHEAHLLKLDCSKARQKLNWVPRWSLETAISHTVAWYQAWQQSAVMTDICLRQIETYLEAKS